MILKRPKAQPDTAEVVAVASVEGIVEATAETAAVAEVAVVTAVDAVALMTALNEAVAEVVAAVEDPPSLTARPTSPTR